MHRRTFLSLAAAGTLAAPRIAAAAETIKLRELYTKMEEFSDLAQALAGQRVTVEGFMAPPLKAESSFFVLTQRPMATCPFCESETEWPSDILAVYTKRVIDPTPFNVGIDTTGVLELGTYTDPETGFVSRVRLTDATYS
ncbi:hypothetical protein [Tranquillimonas rosea]|uniref:hypothetical protein n=1 Tax=Tranquillimonas rosea TaxID=641238 RepID=UPI003BAB8402